MILFKAVHVPMILDDSKSQTRRLWPHGCRAKVGSTHWAQTSFKPDSRFARLRIKRVWRERVGDISFHDANAEGGYTQAGYVEAFARINRISPIGDALRMTVWAVEFEREKESPHVA